MKDNIYRKFEEKDKEFIDVDLNRPKRKMSSRERFQLELVKHQREANEQRLPFAEQPARQEFEKEIQFQIDEQRRTRDDGDIDITLLKLPDTDWAKYSDLKNFTATDEGERFDEDLSKKNPGMTVMIKKTRYKYKDYPQTFTVMESGPDAVKRAQDKAWKDRAQFEQNLKNPKKEA